MGWGHGETYNHRGSRGHPIHALDSHPSFDARLRKSAYPNDKVPLEKGPHSPTVYVFIGSEDRQYETVKQ